MSGSHHGMFSQRTDDVITMSADGRMTLVATIDRMPYEHLFSALAVSIDTTIALFHHVGLYGISRWMRQLPWFCKSIPSEAASVASKIRTAESFGEVWKAALMSLPRSFIDPTMKDG